MGHNPPPRAGILESLRKLRRTGVAALHNRLQLFLVELEEQKLRLLKILVLAGAAIFLGNCALMVVSATIVVLVGEHARPAVLVVLSLVYIVAAVWAFVALRKELRSAPPPFQDSMSELKKDAEWLKPRD
jgi:uncharacterized membrane protein YqjE